MAKGKFEVSIAHKKTVVEGDTPFDAKMAARDELDPFYEFPIELIEVRFLSGFPEFTRGELRFGHEVKPGDSFPDQYNVTETIIRNANDLSRVLASWPPGTTATPPFRPHANSAGSWKIPSFEESREAFRETLVCAIDADRKRGCSGE
jgi:hypothetical protein